MKEGALAIMSQVVLYGTSKYLSFQNPIKADVSDSELNAGGVLGFATLRKSMKEHSMIPYC